MERKYSLAEIDQMRAAIEHEYLWGRGGGTTNGNSRVYMPNEKEFAVEQRLRTYMANGTDPDELSDELLGKGRRVFSSRC